MPKKKNNKVRCSAIIGILKSCKNEVFNDILYCEEHQYLMNSLENEQQNTEPKIIYCNVISCKSEAKDNGYCKTHIKYYERDKIKKRGGKVCSNFGRSKCVNEVVDNKLKTCTECRKKQVKKKDENLICTGRASRTKTYNKCKRKKIDDTKYCETHQYLLEFTEDEQKDINLGNIGKLVNVCGGCNKWNNNKETKCDICKPKKCKGIDRNSDKCRNNARKNLTTCTYHTYMEDYTCEQLNNLKKCNGCHKMYYFTEKEISNSKNGNPHCNNCKELGTKNRKNKKEEEKDLPKCNVESCKYNSKENGYCKKHEKYYERDIILKKGGNVCSNFNRRKCVNEVIDTKFNTCVDCRKKDKESSDKRKKKINGKAEENIEENKKKCNACKKIKAITEFKKKPYDETLYNKSCNSCCEIQKERDAKRGKRDRNYKAELENNPERKAKKQLWKDLNADKMTEYSKKSRAKRRNEDEQKYLERESENAKKWRDKNPNIIQKNNRHKRNNDIYRLKSEKSRAEKQGINWNLEDILALKIINDNCFYCGEKNKDSINGIDRMDSYTDYNKYNCVTSCHMCNVIKGTMSVPIFMFKLEHILHNLKIINKKYYWDTCLNTKTKPTFTKYKLRANKKVKKLDLTEEEYGELLQKEWNLTKAEFSEVIQKECYLCNRQTSDEHHNGIDRYDSNKGYVIENCKACCGQCNIMKNKYDYHNFINKLKTIHTNKNNILNYSRIVESNICIYELNKNQFIPILEEYKMSKETENKYYAKEVKRLRKRRNGLSHIVFNRSKLTKKEFRQQSKEKKKQKLAKTKERSNDDLQNRIECLKLCIKKFNTVIKNHNEEEDKTNQKYTAKSIEKFERKIKVKRKELKELEESKKKK